MPFRRFFERGAKRADGELGEVTESSAATGATSEGDGSEEDDGGVAAAETAETPEAAVEFDWRERATLVLPTGASTGSKRPRALWGDEQADAPSHFARAAGCHVVDALGDTYVDCTMALGAVALGYAEPNVTRAVIEAAANGNVCGLSDVREVEVAERLCAMIPCAEQAQFLKTGAEAIAAAVRLARTYTGRDLVIGCGYFGWLDWASESAGVPGGVRSDFLRVAFDDLSALETAVRAAGERLAAVVIEPVIERLPSPEWIGRARELCDHAGAALIFDEIKTGFRLRTGGYQQYADVVPDLAAFGKAMANGYPLAAVVGRRDLMQAAGKTWISSTLASESTALAAAAVVLAWHEQSDVCGELWKIGAELRAVVGAAIRAAGVEGVTLGGIDPMWLLHFDESDGHRQTRFLELAAKHGVLFKRGAYNFAALAHDEEAIREVERAASAAFVDLRDEESGDA